jgi:hypothetical protein
VGGCEPPTCVMLILDALTCRIAIPPSFHPVRTGEWIRTDGMTPSRREQRGAVRTAGASSDVFFASSPLTRPQFRDVERHALPATYVHASELQNPTDRMATARTRPHKEAPHFVLMTAARSLQRRTCPQRAAPEETWRSHVCWNEMILAACYQ